MAKKKNTEEIKLYTTAIYARYSSHSQNDASIEQQIAECEQYARQNGLQVVGTYEDRAISGKKDNRPGFQRMLRAAERHEFQVLLAYKSNRIARNMINALKTEERLNNAGVRVVYCKEEFGDNVTGRFMLRTMMNMNQFYSENMAEDIRRGMRDSAQKGKVLASIPFGYRKDENGKYAIDELAAPIVQEIFRRVVDDESFADIARDLNSRGIYTKLGKPWGKNSFRSLLTNERYTGTYIYDDIRIEDGMPKIVERSVFDMAQKRIIKLSDIRARHRANEDYLLTGKLFCGHCLSPMVGVSANGNGGRYLYYMCQGHAKKKCDKKNIKKEWIEEEVTRAVLTTVLTDGMIEWIVEKLVETSKRRNAESQLAAYEEQLADVKKQIQNIVRAVEMGIISDSFKERIAELDEDKKNLTGLIAFEKATTIKIDKYEAIAYFEKIRDGDCKDEKFQRMIIRDYIRAVYLFDDYFKLCINFTGKNTVYECLFSKPSGKSGSDTTTLVRLEPEEVHHYYLKRTTVDESRLDFSETGFVLVWYFDK